MRGMIALATLLLASAQAEAVDDRVQAACERDYFAFCSNHDPDGAGVRNCMRANGSKLSNQCVKALIAARELTASEVVRFRSKRLRRAQEQ